MMYKICGKTPEEHDSPHDFLPWTAGRDPEDIVLQPSTTVQREKENCWLCGMTQEGGLLTSVGPHLFCDVCWSMLDDQIRSVKIRLTRHAIHHIQTTGAGIIAAMREREG